MDRYNYKETNLTEKLFAFQLLSVLLTTTCYIWKFNASVSVMIALNFILTTLLLSNEFFKRSNKTILLWILIVFTSFFSALIRVGSLNFNSFKLWLMFISTINLFYWVSIVNVTDKIIKIFFKYTIFITLVFVIASLSGEAYGNAAFTFVTFGLDNPNLTAIYLLNIFLVLSIYLKFLKDNLAKLSCLALIVFCGYYIYMTESRACIIAGFLYLIFYFIGIKYYNTTFNSFIILFPLIFVFLYLKSIDNNYLNEFFDFLVSEGKSLTSREYVWNRALDLISSHPFFGDYLKGGNRHNIHLSVMVNHGNIVFVFFILFLISITNTIGKNAKHPYQYISIYAFYAIMILGTFEGALVSGSQGMYVFSVCLLLIAKYDTEKNYNENLIEHKML